MSHNSGVHKKEGKIQVYVNLFILCFIVTILSAYLYFQVPDKNVSYAAMLLTFILTLVLTFVLTRKDAKEQYSTTVHKLKEEHSTKLRRMRREHDMSTLEKTIRDGTRTLIKNAVDYFKIENIKNEMPTSAAIQNLQLDKYGQIIELLADFSLILPDYHENQEIVQQEITHQIEIYQIDEKAFAQFLQRIMEKYVVTVTKKIREKEDLTDSESMKPCPRCAEKILPKARVCRHCGHELESRSEEPKVETISIEETNWVKKAQSLYRAGNFQEVLHVLDTAIKINPKSSPAYYSRGLLHEKLGNQTQALNDLTAAAQLGHKKAQKFLLSYMDTQEYPFSPS